MIQAPVSEELATALKAHALFTNALLRDVAAEAVERFVDHWHAVHEAGQSVSYQLHQRGNWTALNLYLTPQLGKRIEKLAGQDGVPVRTFAYTALVLFAVDHKLIPPVAALRSGKPVGHEDPTVVELVRALRSKKPKQK
jgi:hypothetical protein